ncbi:MAG: hypothetical protein V1684_01365 [bacterium]
MEDVMQEGEEILKEEQSTKKEGKRIEDLTEKELWSLSLLLAEIGQHGC